MGSAGNPIHASAVSLEGRGMLILGAAGSGKSSLALQLMALGAQLISDDRVCLRAQAGQLFASPPEAIAGQIEARGIGILRARWRAEAALCVAVDLDQRETARLPEAGRRSFLSVALPLLHFCDTPVFPAALLQYLKEDQGAQ